MTTTRIAPALSDAEWIEWRTHRAQLRVTNTDSVRAATVALQTMARNNDLLPDDSIYKFTHLTVYNLRRAADCLEREGHASQAESTHRIASMLFASLGSAWLSCEPH